METKHLFTFDFIYSFQWALSRYQYPLQNKRHVGFCLYEFHSLTTHPHAYQDSFCKTEDVIGAPLTRCHRPSRPAVDLVTVPLDRWWGPLANILPTRSSTYHCEELFRFLKQILIKKIGPPWIDSRWWESTNTTITDPLTHDHFCRPIFLKHTILVSHH